MELGNDTLLRLKLELLERGLDVTPAARRLISGSEDGTIVEREYATTGGLTLVCDDMFVNAPVDEWFCDRPAARLDAEYDIPVLHWRGRTMNPRVLPLPAFVTGKQAPLGVMTHADRARLSPVQGCACGCRFCDWHHQPYSMLEAEQLIAALQVAEDDPALRPRHVLISGGTPAAWDRDALDHVYARLIASTSLPVDVMLMPRPDTSVIDRLVDAGVAGFSINLEIHDPDIAARMCPEKGDVSAEGYRETIRHAVEATGGGGKVRSLLLVGLESEASTLEGVEFLASLGCDPVLSPFRPAEGTQLARQRPARADDMERVFHAARDVAERHGVALGPRCIPCMHNTITVPDGSVCYHYS